MAHVRKVKHRDRQDGKSGISWQARWKGPDGRAKAKNFATKGAADAFLRSTGGVAGDPTMSVKDLALAHYRFFDSLVKLGAREQVTLDGYGVAMDNHLAGDAEFSATKLCDLSTPKSQAWLDGLVERGASLEMARRARRSLVTWCKFGQRKGWLVVNPGEAAKVERVDRPEEGSEALDLPSKAQLAALLAAASEGPDAARDTVVVSILLFAGLRSSELLGLADENAALGRAGGEIRVRERLERTYVTLGRVKSRMGRRDVPIGPATALAVKAWRLQRGKADRLFVNRRPGRPFWGYQDFLRDCWLPMMRRAGLVTMLPDSEGKNRPVMAFGPHALRHAYASIQIEGNIKPKRLQQLMGHSTLKVTMDIYGHLWRDEADDADIARRAEQLARGNAG